MPEFCRVLFSTKGPAWQQVGGINSVGALHDARSKQVPLNPLRARKTSVGQAANPVIRQQSVAQQAQAKQTRHFAGGAPLCCLSPPPPNLVSPPPLPQLARLKPCRHATLQVDRQFAALLAVPCNAARTIRKISFRDNTARPASSMADSPCKLQLVTAAHRSPCGLARPCIPTKLKSLSKFCQATRHADTLRKHPQQEGAQGLGEASPQAPSGDPHQQPFYPNRALADVYGSSLVSSKSEPHGLPFMLVRQSLPSVMGIAFHT